MTRVLNEKFLEFTEKYIQKVRPLLETDSKEIKIAYDELISIFFEQLLLFDKIIIKIQANNYPISILINELGLESFIECLENETIQILLWTPAIMVGKKDDNDLEFKEHPFYPFASGFYSSPEHSDPKVAVQDSFQWVGYNYDRSMRRKSQKIAENNFIMVDKDISTNSVAFIIDSYKSNSLAQFGVPFETSLFEMNDTNRSRVINLASEISDLHFLSNYSAQSYNHFLCIPLLDEAIRAINNAKKSHIIGEAVCKIENIPNFQALYYLKTFDFYSIIQLRKKTESKQFRKWLSEVKNSDDYSAISEEYLNYITNHKNFFDKNEGKFAKDILMYSASILIGNSIGGVTGSITGTALTAILSKTTDFGLNHFTGHLFDKLSQGWKPRMFAENIKTKIKNGT